MANKLTPAQRNLVVETLNLDKGSNYSRLEYYLKQIISGRDVTFETRGDQPFTASSKEAWEIILPWAQDEGSLPVGDRKDLFNIRSRATKLLDYLQTNVSGKTAEAAASYQLILDQAHNKVARVLPSQDPQDYNIQKIYDLRRLQTDILQAGIIGKIYTNLEKSKILAGVPAESRAYVLRMFAAGSQNFRYNPSNPTENFTPEKIHQLFLHTPGDVNSIIRLFYSNAAQEDIKNIVETIESSIQEYGETKYQKEMEIQRNLTTLSPSLGSVSYLLKSIDIHATSAERIALIRNLRSQIINSASGNHQSGETLLRIALQSAGFPVPKDLKASAYKSLLPYLEELEIKERHLLLGSELSDRDSRLLATKNLAKKFGVGLDTPWYSKRDLDQMTTKLAGDKSLQEVFDLESARGDGADLTKLTKLTMLSDLMGKHQDYKIYHDALDGNLWYRVRDVWDKGTGRFQAVKQPIDRFTGKLWAGYDKVNEFIFAPVNKLATWWERQQEKRPWLDPIKLIIDKLAEYQVGIATKIKSWATTAMTSGKWFSGFAGHIADFTEGFIKHKANWGDAGSFFIQRKIGNVLNWSVKTFTKHADLGAFKVHIANTIWAGFSKIAPQLSAKMMAGALSKTITTFLAGELTLGASLAIQVGWEAIKSGFSLFSKAIKSMLHGNPNNLYGAIPALLLAINGIFLNIPGYIIIAVDLLKKALKLLWDAFLALLALAALVAACALVIVVLIWFGLSSPSTQLDTEYIGPASAANLGVAVECNGGGTVAPPAGSVIPLRAHQIVADLHGGFWGYCNRPTNPDASELYLGTRDEIANEKIYTLSNRPNIFAYPLFVHTQNENREPTREELQTNANALYWCTYLVQHSFRESGNGKLANTLWSPTMEDDFRARGKFVEASLATPRNVQPGAVIFFKTEGGPDRTNHVGVVNTVHENMLTFYQSNAPTKSDYAEFGGIAGLQGPDGMPIVGIGNP